MVEYRRESYIEFRNTFDLKLDILTHNPISVECPLTNSEESKK